MLTVLLIEACTYFWKQACIWTWSRHGMSSAVLKSSRKPAGSQATSCTDPVSWTWEITSSAFLARSSPAYPMPERVWMSASLKDRVHDDKDLADRVLPRVGKREDRFDTARTTRREGRSCRSGPPWSSPHSGPCSPSRCCPARPGNVPRRSASRWDSSIAVSVITFITFSHQARPSSES